MKLSQRLGELGLLALGAAIIIAAYWALYSFISWAIGWLHVADNRQQLIGKTAVIGGNQNCDAVYFVGLHVHGGKVP